MFYEFYARTIVGGKWLCVVVKYRESDAFVVLREQPGFKSITIAKVIVGWEHCHIGRHGNHWHLLTSPFYLNGKVTFVSPISGTRDRARSGGSVFCTFNSPGANPK